MTLPERTLEIFHDSFQRCKENQLFFETFYERFIGCSDEVAQLFRSKDLTKVMKMVREALYYKMLASGGSKTSVERLEQLGDLHSSLSIGPHLYDYWLETLMSVVEESDLQFGPEVEQSWRNVMAVGIDIMKSRLRIK